MNLLKITHWYHCLLKVEKEASLSIADMADDETICGCNGVDKGTIVNAITENGFTTVEEVTAKTKRGIHVVNVNRKLLKYCSTP